MTSPQSKGKIALSPSTTLRVLAMTVDRVVFTSQEREDCRTAQHPHCHCDTKQSEVGAEQLTKGSRFSPTIQFLKLDQANPD